MKDAETYMLWGWSQGRGKNGVIGRGGSLRIPLVRPRLDNGNFVVRSTRKCLVTNLYCYSTAGRLLLNRIVLSI